MVRRDPRIAVVGIAGPGDPLASDRRDFYIDHYLRDVHLLGPSQFGALFPEARILRERVLGVAKSLIALYRPPVISGR